MNTMTTSPNCDITLILATCSRIKEVEDFFSSIRSTPEDIRLEIIIADQNDDNRLAPIIEKLPARWKIVHVKSSVKGVCGARNEVIERISSPIVAFPDDDCTYEEGAIANALSLFAANRSADVILGVWEGFGVAFPPKDFLKKENRYSIFKKGEMFVQFYRAEMVRRIGTFDENFGPSPNSRYPFGGDDSDYLARAALAGAKIYRSSKIKIRHPLQNNVPLEKIRGYGITRMALLKKLRYPLWFKAANIFYPLAKIVSSPKKFVYYFNMFYGRAFGKQKERIP